MAKNAGWHVGIIVSRWQERKRMPQRFDRLSRPSVVERTQGQVI